MNRQNTKYRYQQIFLCKYPPKLLDVLRGKYQMYNRYVSKELQPWNYGYMLK